MPGPGCHGGMVPASGYAALVPEADPVLAAEPLAAPPLDADPLPAADPLPPPEPLVDPVHKLEPVPGPVPDGAPGEEELPIGPGGVAPPPGEVPPPGDFPSAMLGTRVTLGPQPMRPNKEMPEAKAMIALRIATSKSRSRAVTNYWKSRAIRMSHRVCHEHIPDSRIMTTSKNSPPMGSRATGRLVRVPPFERGRALSASDWCRRVYPREVRRLHRRFE